MKPWKIKAVREQYEKAWGVSLPEKPGLNNHQMVEGIHKGKLKALYLFGEDMAIVDSNSITWMLHLKSSISLLFRISSFRRQRNLPMWCLPASPSLEKEGTFTNTERRIQRFYQVFEPLGESKPDWEIFQELANRLGANWNYTHPGEIMDEAASLAPIFAGVRYERLEGWDSLVWPVQDGRDTPLLYDEKFGFPDGKARLFPVDWTPP